MHLLFTLFSLQCVCFICGRDSKVHIVVESPKSWRKANHYCQERFHGSLYNNDDNLSLEELSNLPENEPLWMGNYKTRSAWITNIGCYVRIGHAVSTPDTFLENNNPGVCQIICNTSTYFAVKGQTCICLLQNIPANFRKSLDIECNNICRNTSSFELCGGETAYSIYQKVDPNWRLSTQDGNCVAVKCINHGALPYMQYSGRHCSEMHRPLCKMQRGSKMVALDELHTANWTEGAKSCFVENNTTMTAEMNMTCEFGFMQLFNDFFWVGIYRQMVTPIQDEPHGDIQPCTAIMKSPNSNIEAASYNCTKELSFLCQYTLPGSSTAKANELTTIYSPTTEAVSTSIRLPTQDLSTLQSIDSQHQQSNMRLLSTNSEVKERSLKTSTILTAIYSTSNATSNVPEHFGSTTYTSNIITGNSVDISTNKMQPRTVLPTASTSYNDMTEKITIRSTPQIFPQNTATETPNATDSTDSQLSTMENSDSSTGMIIGIVAAAVVVIIAAVLAVCHRQRITRCYVGIINSVRRITILKRPDESKYRSTVQSHYEDLKNRETPREYSRLSHQSFSGYMAEDTGDYIELGSDNIYDSVTNEKQKELKTSEINNDYIDVIEIQNQNVTEETLYTSSH